MSTHYIASSHSFHRYCTEGIFIVNSTYIPTPNVISGLITSASAYLRKFCRWLYLFTIVFFFQLQQLSGWYALVNFPTRGKSCLDNVSTNRKDLFGNCYPLDMQIKTDHSGVILPAGSKLKPIRTKVLIRDRRAHRKIALYQALENGNWNQVLSANHPDQAVEKLEAI